MAVEPFQIVNSDGSVNQSEYDRCIQFLNDYTSGLIKVYPEVTWSNPLEVDLSQNKSALEILAELIMFSNNKLLNKQAFENIHKLFRGLLDRYGSTIHTCGRYLDVSANFTDGPGYMYDVILDENTEVKTSQINSDITIYYLDDDNHTVMEFVDQAYKNVNADAQLPNCNYPLNNLTTNSLTSNVSGYPNIYHGYLSGVYSDFQRLAGQYVGSSTLFYFSECNDILYTTGGSSINDQRLHEIVNFNYKTTVSNKSKPSRGVDLTKVSSVQSQVQNPGNVNAYIMSNTVNSEVNYLSPIFFTSLTESDWIKTWQDETQINE